MRLITVSTTLVSTKFEIFILSARLVPINDFPTQEVPAIKIRNGTLF